MLQSLGLIGGLALLASASPSASAPPALEKAFQGTIVSTYPDGRKAELWMNPDGAFTSMGAAMSATAAAGR